MHVMDRAEWWSFAREGTRTAKVGVVTSRGTPHVTPVWFTLTDSGGDAVVFTTGTGTVKGRALRRDPRVSIVVDDERAPYSFVQFTAEASLSDDVETMFPWAVRIAERYMGPEEAEEFGRRNAVPGEMLVMARITKVVAYAALAE
ncbi:PPOX class F420-dependent oxidoreductase [Saccharomonospora azurea]|nr:PPOX class F420-dependent oxidoreductase [Saccharomonospora azurea]